MDESESSIITENSYSKETMATSESESSLINSKPKIVLSIAINLQDIIIENEQNIQERYMLKDLFYSTHIPMISLEDYLKRILKYTQMEIPTLIIAIMYIDQMCYKKKYILSKSNIYRLIIASSLLSIKFNEDTSFNNSYYAQIGGITSDLMNRLEYEFYVMMDFSLVIDYEYYQKYNSYFSKLSKGMKYKI